MLVCFTVCRSYNSDCIKMRYVILCIKRLLYCIVLYVPYLSVSAMTFLHQGTERYITFTLEPNFRPRAHGRNIVLDESFPR